MSTDFVQQLLRCLSMTEIRSGEDIGRKLGCNRMKVRNHIQTLRKLGVEVDVVPGQGYLLREPLELLHKTTILAAMAPVLREKLSRLDIAVSLDSTNSALKRLPVAQQHGAVILAEHQSTGRGRLGRQWYSPFGRNLYLSLGWRFEKSWPELGCLPLLVALAAVKALERAGLKGHRVKWPNDLLLDGRKLCGCLVEVQGDTRGVCHAVMGVGINIHMPATEATSGINQAWTDLHSQLPDCSRNILAALLLEELFMHLAVFTTQGFSPFRKTWEQADDLKGQTITVYSGNSPVTGRAEGIDEHGALLLDTGRDRLKLHSGEVSLNKTNI